MIIPLGHEHGSVRRLPWVTIAIAVVCLLLQVRASLVEPDIIADATRLEQQALALEQDLEGGGEQAELLEQVGVGALDAGRERRQKMPRGDEPSADSEAETQKRVETLEQITERRTQRDAAIERLPAMQLGYRPKRDGVLRMLSAAFAHGGWMHLIGNMLFLYLVGCNMEDRWGRARFFAFYIGGALVSAFAFYVWHADADTPLVGASGAIAAAMGAFSVCYAATKIRFFYFYWLFIRPRWGTFYAPAWVALPLWFLQQGLMSLIEASGVTDVAYSAHVGGFVYGLVVAVVLRGSGLDEKLLAERDRPERPEDEWSAEPLIADAEGLLKVGQKQQALASLELLLSRDKDHVAARERALDVAFALRDQEKVRSHAATLFTQWLRAGQADLVAARYRELREDDGEFELGEAALKAVINTASSKTCDPLVIVDAVSQLIRQHPGSALLPRAMWAAADAQARMSRADLSVRTLENIVAAFPMDSFAEQARRKLGRSLRPTASSS